MPSYPTVSRGPNRAPRLVGQAAYDPNVIGQIIQHAGDPGSLYLPMDTGDSYSTTLYARLLALLSPTNYTLAEIDARQDLTLEQMGSAFCPSHVMGSILGNVLAFDVASGACMRSADWGSTWEETIPRINWNNPTGSGLPNNAAAHSRGILLNAATGLVGMLMTTGNVGSQFRFNTFLPPYSGLNTSSAILTGTGFSRVCATDGAGTVLLATSSSPFLQKSTDYGATFSTSGITALSSAPTIIEWTGTHWLVYGSAWKRSTDLVTWETVTPGTPITPVTFRSDGNGVVVALDANNNYQLSTDHAETWAASASLGGSAINAATRTDAGNMLLWTGSEFWDFKYGRKSSDGASWSAIPDIPIYDSSGGPDSAPFAIPGFSIILPAPNNNLVYLWPMKRTTFSLVPPGDYASILPSRYWVRAR